MLLRTEELKHFPSHWFRIQSQSWSPPRKTRSLYFLSLWLQVWEVTKPGSQRRTNLLCTNNNGLAWVTHGGGWSSEFLTQVSVALHYVNLLPEKGGSEGAWPSVGLMCVFTRIFWQKQPKLSSYSNTGHEHSGEDSFLLFPCQMKHRAPSLEKERKKEKNPKPTSQSEAPLAMISTQQGTER